MNSKFKRTVKLEKSWLKELGLEFELSYMQELKLFLQSEKKRGKKIFPKGEDMFKALNLTPLDKVKVVILGQILITALVKHTDFVFQCQKE